MTPEDVERRKLDQAERQMEAEIEFRRTELDLRRKELAREGKSGVGKAPWNSAAGLAVIGGIVTVFTAVVANYLERTASIAQQQHQLTLERQKLQSELIKSAIEGTDEEESVARNLNFLWRAGLLEDYPRIGELMSERGLEGNEPVSLPTRNTFGVSATTKNPNIDTRMRVTNPDVPPYNAICDIRYVDNRSLRMRCTGFLVSPQLVLIASSTGFNGANTDHIEVVFNAGSRGAREVLLTPPRQSGTVGSDGVDLLAAIVLDAPFMEAEPLNLTSVSDLELKQSAVSIVGYPAERSGSELWGDQGTVRSLDSVNLYYDMFTTSGMGGSPIFTVDDDGNVSVVAIHVGSTRTNDLNSKYGLRVTHDVLATIEQWKTKAAATAVNPVE